MRIKQSKLGKPDYTYTNVLKGEHIVVCLYHEPQYCVQIITEKDSQCYPLTFEQYNNYCDNAIMILHPNKAIIELKLANARHKLEQFKNDKNLSKFWSNVVDHYARRLTEWC